MKFFKERKRGGMVIKIEKDIPVPNSTRSGRTEVYPFSDMVKGDSFFVELLEGKTERQMLAKMRHAYRKYAKTLDPEPKYTAHIVGEKGKIGIRVWKVD